MITHDFAVSRETFAAGRTKVLADAADSLRPHLKDALSRVGLPSWEVPAVAAALDLFDLTARNEVDSWTPVLDDMHDAFAHDLGEALKKTGKAADKNAQLETITNWVAQMAHNAGIEAAATADPDTGVGLEWVTMHDGDVRTKHRDADGQTVPTGHEFEVGGEKLLYPGQPVGDPSNWINCRCLARPTMLTEAAGKTLTAAAPADEGDPADNGFTTAVIVALPSESDPVSAASSEADGAHCTLLFLGDAATLDEDALKAAITDFITAGQVTPFTDTVSGSATLGKDQADVVLLDGTHLTEIRNGLLSNEQTIVDAYEAVEQFPNFIPHITLGYPNVPRLADFTGDSVGFDRLALWFGESRTEYPLGPGLADAVVAPEQAAALVAMSSLTAAIDTAPLEGEIVPDDSTTADEEAATLDGAEVFAEVPWYGVLAPEGTPSGDGRMFSAGALTNRPLPLPLKFMWEDDEGHKGSYPVGRIDRIFRDGDLIKAEGVFDTSPTGYEAIRLLANRIMRGVSVDIDSAELATDGTGDVIEFSTGRIASATICAIPAFAEAFVAIGTWADADAQVPGHEEEIPDAGVKSEGVSVERVAASSSALEFDIPPVKTMDGPGWITEPVPTHRITSYWVDGRGAAKIGWGVPGDFNRCRANLAKYVTNPEWLAGLCANLHYRALGIWPGRPLAADTETLHQEIGPAASLVAAAMPKISADWFKDPMLTEATPFTVTEDGHIFGHLATWDTCHIGYEVCTTAPPSATNYAYFLTGQVLTDAGPVPVGQVTLGTGHARGNATMNQAIAHYDNTGTSVADITVGEDMTGVWFAGKIRDWIPSQQVHELLAASLSGDWRGVRVGGRESMELCAALAVNVPGFPVPRTRFALEGERQLSLTAAGIPDKDPISDAEQVLSDLRSLEFAHITEKFSTMEGK